MPVFRPHPVYFPMAVRSILGQSMSDFELIIVEDPSERTASEFIESLGDPRIHYHRNCCRTSLIAQRNLAIDLCSGMYLAFMDADDISEPDRLHVQLSFLENHAEIDVLGSQVLVIDSFARLQGFRSFPLEHDDIIRAMTRMVPISQPTVMLRRQKVLEAGKYESNGPPVAEDYALWSKMARCGMRFANLPVPLIRYRCHSEQLKCVQLRQTLLAVIAVKEKHWRDAMDWRALTRLWFEKAMLWLPSRLVWQVICFTLYRDRLPTQRLSESNLWSPDRGGKRGSIENVDLQVTRHIEASK